LSVLLGTTCDALHRIVIPEPALGTDLKTGVVHCIAEGGVSAGILTLQRGVVSEVTGWTGDEAGEVSLEEVVYDRGVLGAGGHTKAEGGVREEGTRARQHAKVVDWIA
jgi:hypothetical protein